MGKEKNTMEKFIFDGLSEQEREICRNAGRTRAFAKGEILVAEGDMCQGLLILTSGEIARQKYTPGGEFSTLDICEAGEVLGMEFLLPDATRYGYTVEALSAGSLCTISKDALAELESRFPRIRDNLLRLFANQIRHLDERIDMLSQKSIRQKIAVYLLSQISEQDEGNSCEMPGTKESAARYFGLPRPSLSRELMNMEKEGLILVNGRSITILNREALGRIVDET